MNRVTPTRFWLALVAFSLLASALSLVSALAPTAQAAATQITVFKHSGAQTASQYFAPTLSQPADYNKPADYKNGHVYVKLDVLSKPSNRSIIPQLCFWRHTDTEKFKFETCAITRKFAFTTTGTVWIDAGTPASWYKKNGRWDWSKQASLGRIMLKDTATGKLLLNQRCGAACYERDDLDKHVPVRITAEVIFVAKGAELSPPGSWRAGCPASWSSGCRASGQQPTPKPAPTATPKPAPTATPKPLPTATPKPAATSRPTPAPTSGQPKIAILSGNRLLKVTWSTTSGSRLSQLRYQGPNGGWKWDPPTQSRSRTITGLDSDKNYTVQVRALVRGKWQEWVSASATPRGQSGSSAGPIASIPSPPNGHGQTILLIGGGGSGLFADAPYVAALRTLGYEVTVVRANALTKADLKNKKAAVISSSVKPNQIPSWLAESKVPLLVSEAYVMDELGMATRGRDSGNQRSLEMVAKHAANGRTIGDVTLGRGRTKFASAEPGSGAKVLAEHSNGAAAIYLYTRGARMTDGKAPAKRIGWYMAYPSPGQANPDAWNLFGHAIAWLTR